MTTRSTHLIKYYTTQRCQNEKIMEHQFEVINREKFEVSAERKDTAKISMMLYIP